MTGVVWRPGCPVGLDDLRLVTATHRDLAGAVATGELVVAVGEADDVLGALEALFDAGFAIERMRPVEAYGGDDAASMADNNTSAFNCRTITGGTAFSRHAYGDAIDLNPVQNPYVRGERVEPAAGTAYVVRTAAPGVILADGPVVEAFAAIGWSWGGAWTSLKDYQHLSATGR
jgi:poly-gamma-glutamate synthesis protein (capsule biosynthesis protein)